MSSCVNVHCRLLRVVASDWTQFKEKIDMLMREFCCLFWVRALFVFVVIMGTGLVVRLMDCLLESCRGLPLLFLGKWGQ